MVEKNTSDAVIIAERHVESLKTEHEQMIKSLERRIAAANQAGRSIESTTLSGRIVQANKIHADALSKAESALEFAKQAHDAQEQAKQADAESKEAVMKARALDLWLKNGGLAADFDKHWPELRSQMAAKAVMADLEARKPQKPKIAF